MKDHCFAIYERCYQHRLHAALGSVFLYLEPTIYSRHNYHPGYSIPEIPFQKPEIEKSENLPTTV